jgi:hypothetical protein
MAYKFGAAVAMAHAASSVPPEVVALPVPMPSPVLVPVLVLVPLAVAVPVVA